ncbi:VOC family protein [Arenibacterium sp. CAU 1754]
MVIRRIVANLHTEDPGALAGFYRDVFGLEPAMDQGWIVTLQEASQQPVQLSMAAQGGSDTALPALSIDVDDLDDILARARALGHEPEYGPINEPWGVRRFYLRDPAGTLLNILTHRGP